MFEARFCAAFFMHLLELLLYNKLTHFTKEWICITPKRPLKHF